jgi:hypothetical protein
MIHQTNLMVQTFLNLAFFCNVYMATLSIVLIGFWSLPNWQRSWKLNARNFCATSKLDGYL